MSALLDYDLDAPTPYAAKVAWVVGPGGDFSPHGLGKEDRHIQSVLVRAGGRVFVNEDGGRKSKAARGHVILEPGVNCSPEEYATLEEWRARNHAGAERSPIPIERLPRLVNERRHKAAVRSVERLEGITPMTEEAARLHALKIQRAKRYVAQLESTLNPPRSKGARHADPV